jgi:hypothetical protein
MHSRRVADAPIGMLRLLGIFAFAVGAVLCADLRGAATTLRNRRAKWSQTLAGPIWIWRAWGAFVAICGLMLVIRPV